MGWITKHSPFSRKLWYFRNVFNCHDGATPLNTERWAPSWMPISDHCHSEWLYYIEYNPGIHTVTSQSLPKISGSGTPLFFCFNPHIPLVWTFNGNHLTQKFGVVSLPFMVHFLSFSCFTLVRVKLPDISQNKSFWFVEAFKTKSKIARLYLQERSANASLCWRWIWIAGVIRRARQHLRLV